MDHHHCAPAQAQEPSPLQTWRRNPDGQWGACNLPSNSDYQKFSQPPPPSLHPLGPTSILCIPYSQKTKGNFPHPNPREKSSIKTTDSCQPCLFSGTLYGKANSAQIQCQFPILKNPIFRNKGFPVHEKGLEPYFQKHEGMKSVWT